MMLGVFTNFDKLMCQFFHNSVKSLIPVLLSNPNRPTQLAEQYNEIYDNQWTDAFDILKNKQNMTDETKVVQQLKQILFVSTS